MHALIEVLELQLALRLGAGLADAVGTFDPLLLKGVAACRPLVGLLSALQQQPAVQADAEPRLQIHERHDANGAGAGRGGNTWGTQINDWENNLSAMFSLIISILKILHLVFFFFQNKTAEYLL